MKKKGKNYYTTYFVYYLIQGRTEDLRILGALAFSPRKARENFLSAPPRFSILLGGKFCAMTKLAPQDHGALREGVTPLDAKDRLQ